MSEEPKNLTATQILSRYPKRPDGKIVLPRDLYDHAKAQGFDMQPYCIAEQLPDKP